MLPRILMQIHQYSPIASGAELQAKRLAEKLVVRGHQIQILTQLRVPGSAPEEISNGVSIHRVSFPMSFRPFFRVGYHLKYLVQHRHTFDIIHSHQCFNHAVLGTVLGSWFGKKSIVKFACAGDIGDLHVFSQFEHGEFSLRMLQEADAYIAISSEIEQELVDRGFPQKRIHRIPNGVDTDYFRRELPMPDTGKTVFIIIGRRTPQKGIDVVIKALKILKEKGFSDNDLEVRSYGWDYAEFDYRTMASGSSVNAMLSLLPYTDEIIKVYHDAHCFLLPSRAEGLSNALLEAMSFELPVIASRVSGNTDVIEHQKCGILIPPEDPTELASAMEFIMRQPGAAQKIGRHARQRVIEHFSLDKTADCYAKLYKKLLCHE